MSDEKRIKDFEPATEILNDDWFAVDSPSQGTRKMQASMFQAGLQNQITANRDDIDLQSGQISVLQQGVGNIGDKVDVLDAAITVEEYSATKLYAVDEDCVYEGVRYKCITAIESPEAFTPSHWQAISIEGELNELNSSFANSLNNLKFKFVSKTITIPDGSTSSPKTVDVDLASDLPTGASIVGVVSASIGAYRLPYTSNSGVSQTWIYLVTNSTTVVVENTTTGWGTSTIYLLVSYS